MTTSAGRAARDRVPRHPIAATVAVVGVVCSLLLVAVAAVTSRPDGPTPPLVVVLQGFGVMSATCVGAIVISRQPRNRLGGLLFGAGFIGAVGLAATDIADYGLVAHPGSVPGAIWIAWLSNWVWAVYLIPVAWLVPMLFPSGHLPSPRWRIMLVLAVACTVVGSVATALQPLSSFPASVQSPLVVTGPGADLLSAANTVATIIGVTTIPLIAWSLIQRFRRSSGVECQQYKWFAAAVAVAAPPLVVGLALTNASTGVLGTISSAAWDLVFIGLGLIPLAIGVAVLRYRLYEIDRLVSRTISYAVVTAILAAAFAGSILVLQALLAPVTGGQTVAVAGSTLAAFALVSPLLRRVRGLVDRRFDRARYDAERTAAAFADRLRDEVDLAVVSADLARTAAGSLSPASIGLWLRGEEAAR